MISMVILSFNFFFGDYKLRYKFVSLECFTITQRSYKKPNAWHTILRLGIANLQKITTHRFCILFLIYLHLEETQLVCVYDKNPMMMLSTC